MSNSDKITISKEELKSDHCGMETLHKKKLKHTLHFWLKSDHCGMETLCITDCCMLDFKTVKIRPLWDGNHLLHIF